ncbi:MAG TPA: orotidine-5'-phosphate decarboxylase [Kiloniellaceae bacterium]|nr:orotidine-5'-phosphate decarboxylase [Kiloniellaceae bacterium]
MSATADLQRNPVLVAIDTSDMARAHEICRQSEGLVGGLKFGKEFFTAHGPDGVRRVAGEHPFFLDLKFHDIPNTVAGAIRAAVGLGPFMVNLHASGGRAMMEAAIAAAEEGAAALGRARPLVIAVTVLTSLDDEDLVAVGQPDGAAEQVLRLARLAQDCGLDGVVCSPKEIDMLRAACGPDFKLVVPGIRPAWAASGDQKRIMTPGQAVAAGADYIVVGRAITGADDPAAAAQRILAELAA